LMEWIVSAVSRMTVMVGMALLAVKKKCNCHTTGIMWQCELPSVRKIATDRYGIICRCAQGCAIRNRHGAAEEHSCRQPGGIDGCFRRVELKRLCDADGR
jgi:hypothetical protein